jgi:hypothetical protein
MTDADHVWTVRLKDLKARKGHLCQGGQYSAGVPPMCGCGTRLDLLPDFMDLPPDVRRQATGNGTPPVDQPPLVSGGDVPPAPFMHANGEPCYGCQTCFANLYDDDQAFENEPGPSPHDSDHADAGDIMAEADAVEAAGRDVAVRHGAPDLSPAVPVIDPTTAYGPMEVERAMLDANRRLELGLKHEANLIAAADQFKVEYELAYARSVAGSHAGAADQRKAEAVLASEPEYRRWRDAVAARDAMRSITHTLRSTLSALQSVSRSVGVSYTGPQGRGQ